MAVGRLKTWITEVLTKDDLNGEFDNILSNGEDLGWPATKAKDMNGQELILDGNGNTSITADTDDRIDFRLGGADLFQMDGTVVTPINGLNFIASATLLPVQIVAFGTDSNISIDLTPKGTGGVNINGPVKIKGAGLRNEISSPYRTSTLAVQASSMSAGEAVLASQVFC